MKVTALNPSSRIAISFGFLNTTILKILAFKLLFFFIFLGIFSAKGQQVPGFYDEVSSKVLIDSTTKLLISSINITGNKKTKKYIIEREMRLKVGDSILASSIYEKLIRSQELVYNTTLFTEVTMTPNFITATNISIQVTVKEKWYIYPTPVFQLADRNFNEWISGFYRQCESGFGKKDL